ncbi:cypmaclein-like [Silene latifolia]|uniref:cypmaclein-like n=1 Tax=Silene latifolia TaxID=37657 RepID=UPI003D77644D
MSSINRILLLAIFCLVVSHELEVCIAKPAHGVHGAFMGAKINCKEKCFRRCELASRYRRCFRACSTCCERCNCVPPGTSGNAAACPCWANMTTTGGRKKCP